MARPLNEAMMYRAAALYCYGDRGTRLTKGKIARRLETSPTQVSRWLEEAEERGIVKLLFDPPRCTKLEALIRERFGLREAIVVPSAGTYVVGRKLRGRALAEYFDSNVKDDMTVAVAGGETIFEMALALRERTRARVRLVPTAIIGRGPQIVHIDPTVNLSIIWSKSGARPNSDDAALLCSTTVIPYPDSEEGSTNPSDLRDQVELLRNLSKVEAVVEMMRSADVIISSCGAVPPLGGSAKSFDTVSQLTDAGISRGWLREQGAIGDISYAFINEKGDILPGCNLFLTLHGMLGTEAFRELVADPKKQVVLTSGEHTDEVLRAALKGKLCNVLVIDENTAETLLK